MTRHILECNHAMVGNSIDTHKIIIEFDDESLVRFATYVEAPNGIIRWREIHDTLGEACRARDDKLADRREVMMYELPDL